LDRTVAAICGNRQPEADQTDDCCTTPAHLGQEWWPFHERKGTETVDSIVFEDHDGTPIRFGEFFKGRPSIVVFFYSRCDNPWKCSLTVAKLARVQQLFKERGIYGQVQTAAITYDPVFDLPKRMREYGRERGLQFNAQHRALRATEGFDALRSHFCLGVNFIESLVNRHRVELYVLDGAGRVAASFERIHWDESQVVDRACEVLRQDAAPPVAARPSFGGQGQVTGTVLGTLASLAWAFFPKCPMCWAAYLSIFGIAGFQQIPYPSKTHPALLAVMLINIVSVWFRARATQRIGGFCFVCAGIVATILGKMVMNWDNLAAGGIALTFAGSLWGAVNIRQLQFYLRRIGCNFG